MSHPKILARSLTTEVPGGFELTFESDDGQIFRVFATENQVNDLADELLGFLDDDEVEFTAEKDQAGEDKVS